MAQKHKHHDVIVAWAAGAEIEEFIGGAWRVDPSPDWFDSDTYRIKPEPPAKVYPVTGMSDKDLIRAFCKADHGTSVSGYRGIANDALRHAIDSGQLIQPERPDELQAYITKETFKANGL